MKNYVVTVTAADRVGIVHSVTGTVRDEGGNVLELSQTVMRGFFTIILVVEFPEPMDTRVLAASIIEKGRKFQLTVAVLEADAQPTPPKSVGGDRFILTVLGNDHPGNIYGIAGCLADRGVNIVDLHARAEGPIFSLVMEAYLPSNRSPGEIREALEKFGKDLGLEAYVQHENIFLATTEPRPVRVGPTPNPEGEAVVPH